MFIILQMVETPIPIQTVPKHAQCPLLYPLLLMDIMNDLVSN